MGESGVNPPQTKANEANEIESGPATDPLIGLVFDKRYEISALLGSGATSLVYKACDIMLSREVAVKIIHKHLLSSPQAIERFKNEALTSTALSHPNIAKVYRQGVADEGRLYMIMDCLEGESLAALIERQSKLPLNEFFDVFLQVADALNYAHQQQVVHRDIKPNNIILTAESGARKAMLVDFGIAKCVAQESSQSSTQTGALLGSSAYMSPEQCLGLQDIDARTDIYSLGCVMLESLLGKTPFQGESALDVMYKHLNESPEQLACLKELPEAISRIIQKCLKKERAERYQSLSELKQDLLNCSEMRDTLQRRWQKQQKKVAPGRVALLAALALFLACAGLLTYFLHIGTPVHTPKLVLEAKKSVKSLVAPEQAQLPLHADDLQALVNQYKKEMGPLAVLELLKQWQLKREKMAGPEDQTAVLAMLSRIYIELEDSKNALIYADKVYKNKRPRESSFAACHIVDMYMNLGLPAKGLATIENLHKEYPEMEFETEDRINMIAYQGQCRLKMKDFKRAAALLRQAQQLSSQIQEPGRITAYAIWRGDLINALIRTGQKSEIAAVIKSSVDAATASRRSLPDALANTYWHIGHGFLTADQLEESNKYFELAFQQYRDIPQTKGMLDCEEIMAATCRELKQYQRALSLQKDVLSQRLEWNLQAQSLDSMSKDSASLNDRKAAYVYARQSLAICEQHLKDKAQTLSSEGDMEVIMAVCHLRDLLTGDGKTAEAEQLLDDWIAKTKAAAGDCVVLAQFYQIKGFLCTDTKQFLPALRCADMDLALLQKPELRKRCELSKLSLAPRLADAYTLKSVALANMSREAEALEAARAGVLSLEGSKYNAKMVPMLEFLGSRYQQSGKLGDAAKCFARAESIWRQLNNTWDIGSAYELARIAAFKTSRKDYAGAEKNYKECIDGLIAHYKEIDKLPWFYNSLADAMIYQNKLAAAVAPLRESIRISRKTGLKDNTEKDALNQLWSVSLQLHDYSNAEKYMEKYIAKCSPEELANAYYKLDIAYTQENNTAGRIACLKKALKALAGVPKAGAEGIFMLQHDLGLVYQKELRFKEAESALADALKTAPAIADSSEKKREISLAAVYRELATVQVQDAKLNKAEQNYAEAAKYYEKLGPSHLPELKVTLTEWLAARKADKIADESETAALEARLQKLN